MILVVSNSRRWERAGRDAPLIEGFHFACFAEVTPDLLDDLGPEVVLSALMEETFDAIDLARVLGGLGFRGRYRAITNALPNPEAVRAEVRGVAADLDFDLFILDTPVH